MEIIAKAQMKLRFLVAERKVESSLQERISQYNRDLFHIGDNVLAQSEKHNKRFAHLIVSYVDERMVKMVAVRDTQNYMFSSFQVFQILKLRMSKTRHLPTMEKT